MSATPAPAEFSWGRTSLKNLEIAAPRGVAEIGSIALGALLFGVLGFAMEWRPGYILVAAAGFAASTWLARSLGRAFICMVGALGLTAGFMVLIAKTVPEVTGTLGLGWGALFVLWWLVTVAVSVTFRASGAEPEFNASLAFGCTVSVGIAVIVALKLNFQSDLLFYLVGLEDNAAWVGLATQNSATSSVAAQFSYLNLGPSMPLLLGVLEGAQGAKLPATNSVFASYTLAVVLSPLLAATLVGTGSKTSWVRNVAFVLIVFAWLFLVPALLYRDFGHLSTIWATLALLTFAALVCGDLPAPRLIVPAFGVLAFMGGAWFPIAPLAGLLMLFYALRATRESGRRVRLLIAGIFAVAGLVLLFQLRAAGVSIGTDLEALKGSIENLYRSPGGVAQLDPALEIIAIAGIVGLSFVATKLGRSGPEILLVLLITFGYVLAVYGLGAILNIGPDSYGVTKVAFVILFASIVVLSAVVVRLPMNSHQSIAAGLALAFGALTLGGGTLLLQRSWPGDGSFPSWLPALESVARSQEEPRPIVCYASNDGQASYFCTRWAGAISKAGDGDYLNYRLAAFKGTITRAEMRNLGKSGVIARSDVLFLQRPTRNAWWGKVLLEEGGRVFGPTGKPLKRRSISAIELLPPPAPAK